MRIAVPIVAGTMEEALYDIEKASKVADILELRIDYMHNPNLKKLLASSQLPKILTCRPKAESGKFEGNEDQRFSYFQEAIDLGAEYVDIESGHLRPISKKSTKLILSYHNFDKTPDNLDGIYRDLVAFKPDLPKIATMARSYDDSLRMLNLLHQVHEEGGNLIGLCMGEKGEMTRVFGPHEGSYLTFASLETGKESAPGQIAANDLRNMWKTLKYF